MECFWPSEWEGNALEGQGARGHVVKADRAVADVEEAECVGDEVCPRRLLKAAVRGWNEAVAVGMHQKAGSGLEGALGDVE